MQRTKYQVNGSKNYCWIFVVVVLCSNKVSSQKCTFSTNRDSTYSAICNVINSSEIKLIANKSLISSITLSNNKLKSLKKGNFQNFSRLRFLYLDHNLIKNLGVSTFSNLSNLEILDLSSNQLQTWSGDWTKDLSSLRSLNLDHNDDFELKKTDLTSTYASFTGTNVAGHQCKVCNLTRVVNVSRALLVKKMLGQFLRQGCIYYPDKEEDAEAETAIETIRRKYVMYKGACQIKPPKQKTCDIHLTSLLSLERYFKDRCYRGARALKPIVFILGSIGFILNLFVVTAILSLKRLRNTVPFLLIAHLSFCDFLTGVYALGTASGHEVSPDFHHIRQYRESYSKCGVFWVIFLLGQTLGVLTCLLVTIERFLATVYCMKPDLKLERRTALIILPVFWIVSLLIAIPLQQIDLKKITINFMCVLLRDYSKKKGFFVSQGLMIAYLILYVIVVVLYCRIYAFVRKSSRQVNVNREAKLAKRIGLIVFTNFVCFALPNFSMLIFTTTGLYAPLDDIPNTIIRRWVPPMFLVVNATVNPFFFAFGNKLFSSSVKGALRRLLIKHLDFNANILQTSKVYPTEMNSKSNTTASTIRMHYKRGQEESTVVTESHA